MNKQQHRPTPLTFTVRFCCCVQDLSNETIARLDAENKYQTLMEEIEFLKSIHEQASTHLTLSIM